MNLTRGINLKKIAELMPGASGAEVKGVCTEVSDDDKMPSNCSLDVI
jgi:ATP-dependent 26S proteasome regulatory subunit